MGVGETGVGEMGIPPSISPVMLLKYYLVGLVVQSMFYV